MGQCLDGPEVFTNNKEKTPQGPCSGSGPVFIKDKTVEVIEDRSFISYLTIFYLYPPLLFNKNGPSAKFSWEKRPTERKQKVKESPSDHRSALATFLSF